jgi:tetratricopeptide (TPR) repeat protein
LRRARALVLAAAVAVAGTGCRGAGQKPVEENPLTSDLINYRNGLALLREGKVDEAIALLNAARASYPTEPAVSNGLGLALLYKKDYQPAIRAFSEALRLNPEFVEARNNRGVAWMEMGKINEAEADFQAVLGGNTSREKLNAHFNQGLLEVKREAWEAAEKEFTVVLAEDPKYVRANRERGIVRVRREAFADALDDLLRYLRTEPRDVSANYNAALALLTTGRRDVARKYMQRAIAAAPESDEAKKAKRFLDDEPAGPARRER